MLRPYKGGHARFEFLVKWKCFRFGQISLRIAVGCELPTFLLAGRIGRSADMQMAQIPQRRSIFVAHAFGEIRIV
jgi:hypothetical protein